MKWSIVIIAVLFAALTFNHPKVRHRFSMWLAIATMLFAVTGCASKSATAANGLLVGYMFGVYAGAAFIGFAWRKWPAGWTRIAQFVVVFGGLTAMVLLGGCATTHRIPATVVDGGVNVSNIHEARCAVQRDGIIVLMPRESDCK